MCNPLFLFWIIPLSCRVFSAPLLLHFACTCSTADNNLNKQPVTQIEACLVSVSHQLHGPGIFHFVPYQIQLFQILQLRQIVTARIHHLIILVVSQKKIFAQMNGLQQFQVFGYDVRCLVVMLVGWVRLFSLILRTFKDAMFFKESFSLFESNSLFSDSSTISCYRLFKFVEISSKDSSESCTAITFNLFSWIKF